MDDMARTAGRIGHDELATLKLVALDGALESRTTVTCAALERAVERDELQRRQLVVADPTGRPCHVIH